MVLQGAACCDENHMQSRTNRETRNNRYAVILAGGDGSRLRSLTRAIAGDERPKQFCPILNDSTLLDETRKRVAIGVSPANTFFSLTQKHERFYQQPLSSVSELNKVIQPENKGTAPAILYSLVRLARVAPDATVAFFPSDHYFADDAGFMSHVDSAFRSVELNPESIVLLGIEADKAETSYGWIQPVQSLFGNSARSVARVSRFWEKPTKGVAQHLLNDGCLWNSFVMIGKVGTFLELFRDTLPGMFRMFATIEQAVGRSQEQAVIRAIYSWINETNFSSEVLERSADRLLVMRVRQVGWSDWGEPNRVLGTLASLGLQPDWMQALAA